MRIWRLDEGGWAAAEEPLDAVARHTEQPSLLGAPLLLPARGAAQARTGPLPLLQPRCTSPPSPEAQPADGAKNGAQVSHLLGGVGSVTKYVGVYFKALKQTQPILRHHHLAEGGRVFPDAVSAAKAYDWAVRLIGHTKRRLNVGREVDLSMPPAFKGAAELQARVSQMGGTGSVERDEEERYVGVDYSVYPFTAQIYWRSEIYDLGSFLEELPAAKAYDWAARLIGDGWPLNLNPSDDLGASTTTAGSTRLRADVAAAAAQAPRSLSPGVAQLSVPIAPLLAPAQQQQQQQRLPSPAAGAAAKRPACAPPSPSPPPAAKKRRSLPEPQPAPSATAAPLLSERDVLASQLRVLLRLRHMREDDLALDELSEGALRDILADVHISGLGDTATQAELAADLQRRSAADYFNSPLDLSARLAVSVRISRWQPRPARHAL